MVYGCSATEQSFQVLASAAVDRCRISVICQNGIQKTFFNISVSISTIREIESCRIASALLDAVSVTCISFHVDHPHRDTCTGMIQSFDRCQRFIYICIPCNRIFGKAIGNEFCSGYFCFAVCLYACLFIFICNHIHNLFFCAICIFLQMNHGDIQAGSISAYLFRQYFVFIVHCNSDISVRFNLVVVRIDQGNIICEKSCNRVGLFLCGIVQVFFHICVRIAVFLDRCYL